MPPPQAACVAHPWSTPACSLILMLRSEPFDYVSLELFQMQQKTFMLSALGKKKLGYKSSCFNRLFWDLCARVVTSHAIMVLSEGLPMERNLMMRILS